MQRSLAGKIVLNFLVPAILVLLPFAIPVTGVPFDIGIILSVVALLYTILVGFFIATTTQNYLRLQTLISAEDSGWINLFNLVGLIAPESKASIASAIDAYVVAALTYPLIEYVEKTEKTFKTLVVQIDRLTPKTKKGWALLQNLHNEKRAIVQSRHEIPLVAQRIMTNRHWVIIALLAVLLVGLIYLSRDGTLAYQIIAATISVAAYYIMLLIYEIDSDIFVEEKLSYENSQKIFAAIGKPNYYPREAIRAHVVHPSVQNFRQGFINSRGQIAFEKSRN